MAVRIFIIIIIVGIIIISCTGDYNIDCGNNYVYLHEGVSLNKIVKKSSGNSFSFGYTHVIPISVINYNYNENIIIAIQVDEDTSIHNSIDRKVRLMDSMNYNYWIIESDKDSIYGPLPEQRYLDKRSELSIPNSLIFDNRAYSFQ